MPGFTQGQTTQQGYTALLANEPLLRPTSISISWVNWAGFLTLLATLGACLHWNVPPLVTFLLAPASFAMCVIVLEWAIIQPLPWSKAAPKHFSGRFARVFVRCVAFYATFIGIILLYWALPYARTSFLLPLVRIVGDTIIVYSALAVFVLTPIYLWLTDDEAISTDGAYALGLWLLGKSMPAAPNAVRNHLLAWAVKAFFLPLMARFLWGDIVWLHSYDWSKLLVNFTNLYEFLFRTIFLLDVAMALAGYLLTLKPLGAQIRSTEPTIWGWLVCLACYPPLWPMVYNDLAAYNDAFYWGNWLARDGFARICYGSAILVLCSVYLWATIEFGIRFSNLTNRGIVTSGPYRYVKHPAYLAKNLSWWLISVPFISTTSASEALRLSLLLGFVNLIYYWRAKTEEAHLSADPTYQAYQAWIAEHGLFARLQSLTRTKKRKK
jgi:protein-S-isoprenylcysteine O-methyltransferase Ste14